MNQAKLYKADGTILEVVPANGTDFQLDELQAMVGGYIEIIPVLRGKSTLLELVKCSPLHLLRQRNFGRKSLREIHEFLEQRNLHLEMTDEEIREYSINQLKLEREL